MQRTSPGTAGKLDVGAKAEQSYARLRLVSSALVGREKYRVLDLKRRRAQIRARRELGLI